MVGRPAAGIGLKAANPIPTEPRAGRGRMVKITIMAISDNAIDHLPLKPLDLEILLALAEADQHGYGLVQAVASHTNELIVLDPGNLYRVIKRLLETRLVAESARRSPGDEGDRRRYYKLTPLGERVLSAELERLRRFVNASATRSVARKLAP
jgi:DNA-binding PadR family transcriptional regulator